MNARPLVNAAPLDDLPWEPPGAQAARLDAFLRDLKPQGAMEVALVERLAWLEARRARLKLAERALHLAALHDATSDDQRRKRLAGAAVAGSSLTAMGPDEVTIALHTPAEEDAADRADLDADVAATAAALDVLKAGGEQAYGRALETLHPETLEAWRSRLEEAAEDDAEASDDGSLIAVGSRVGAEAMGLAAYLTQDLARWFDRRRAELDARPAVRALAWGFSVEPDRLERLLAIDSRLDRQIEKALAMLLKLQEIRRGRALDET